MKYAFLAKNFRLLSFELKTLVITYALGALACFLPWFTAKSLVLQAVSYNAFSHEIFLLGLCVFFCSLAGVALIVDRFIWKSQKIKLPIPETAFFIGISAETILLIILAWSVLFQVGSEAESASYRFGFFVALGAHIIGLIAAILYFQVQKQQVVRDFFQHPPIPSPASPGDTQPPSSDSFSSQS